MSVSSHIISTYGQTISVGNVRAKGFISPVNESDAPGAEPLEMGVGATAKYRLLTDCISVAVGCTVVCEGTDYLVQRVDAVSILGSFSHYECILIRKGRWADV